MRTRREQKRQQREADILQHAAHIIEQAGYSALTMEGLAESVGISRPTLYQHFKNKEDVVEHMALCQHDELHDFLRTLSGKSVHKLNAILRFLLAPSDDKIRNASNIAHDEIFAMMQEHPRLAQRFNELYAMMEQIIEQGKTEGDIDPALSNEVVMASLFSLLNLRQIKDMIHTPLSQDEIIDQAVRLYLRGIRP